MFFLILVVLLVLPTIYLVRRLVSSSGLVGPSKKFATAATIALPVLATLEPLRWQLRDETAVALDVITIPATTALGLFSVLLTFTVLRDIGVVVVWVARRLRRPAVDVDHDRRQFLGRSLNAGVVGASGITAAAGARAASSTRVLEVDVPIEGLSPSLDGFRIVQISDLHVGPQIGAAYIEHVVALASAVKPNLVALTGDFVDGSVFELLGDISLLRAIPSTHGTFFVTGNHEYYSGATKWNRAFQDLGFHVLENRHMVIEHEGARVVIAGVNDLQAERFDHNKADIEKAFAGAGGATDDDTLRILLAHQPRTIEQRGDTKFHLQLSGHTHGGQFFPWNFAIHLVQKYVAGLYDVDGVKLYVSRGTGFWGPRLRLMAPSEVTLLTLRRQTPAP